MDFFQIQGINGAMTVYYLSFQVFCYSEAKATRCFW